MESAPGAPQPAEGTVFVVFERVDAGTSRLFIELSLEPGLGFDALGGAKASTK